MTQQDDGVGTLTPVEADDPPDTELTPAQLRAQQAARISQSPPPVPADAPPPLTEGDLVYDAVDADRRENVQALQEARDILGISAEIDPLRALLEGPGTRDVTDTWSCKRLRTTFKIRAITNKEYGEVQDQATRQIRNRRTGRMDKDLDATLMSMLTCVRGTMEPDFTRVELRQHYHVPTIHEVVGAALLPGEVDSLAGKILKISGFDDDLEEAGKD